MQSRSSYSMCASLSLPEDSSSPVATHRNTVVSRCSSFWMQLQPMISWPRPPNAFATCALVGGPGSARAGAVTVSVTVTVWVASSPDPPQPTSANVTATPSPWGSDLKLQTGQRDPRFPVCHPVNEKSTRASRRYCGSVRVFYSAGDYDILWLLFGRSDLVRKSCFQAGVSSPRACSPASPSPAVWGAEIAAGDRRSSWSVRLRRAKLWARSSRSVAHGSAAREASCPGRRRVRRSLPVATAGRREPRRRGGDRCARRGAGYTCF